MKLSKAKRDFLSTIQKWGGFVGHDRFPYRACIVTGEALIRNGLLRRHGRLNSINGWQYELTEAGRKALAEAGGES